MWQVSAVLLIGLTTVSGAFKLYYDKAEAEKEAIAMQLRQSADNQVLLESSISQLNEQILQGEKDKEETFKRINLLQEAKQELQKKRRILRNIRECGRQQC